MQDYEQLGAFYLGRKYDLDSAKATEDLLLYDSKDLTTHAVCVGMTGSGKTGLCLALLEEAAIDGIPAIVIDPKGDLGNLLLTFPELRPADFEPWIDPAEAARRGIDASQLAMDTAERWRAGLAESGEQPERIARLRAAADIAIYTPGSSAGLPLTVLRSFKAPPAAVRDNSEALRDALQSAASGLLGLMGIEADPLRSREHILISSILDHAWQQGRDVELSELIHSIQTPPMQRIGVIDLESFYPAKERFELSLQLNNLLASPGFSAWLEGEPLDIQRLLYTPAGKPRIAILSISHLSDAERMFFVTLVLSAVVSWMRTQSGTSSLRAILYMDEVFGYLPPTANPPSKLPLLTLLKQARAFGLGIVLATQNPVDLDYKALSNAGTWLLGRLQTERDKLRVLDGLEGASTTAGRSFDRARMERVLSGLGNRVFLMNNVHEDEPVVFQSRWALSFLRGPLTREQISQLMAPRKAALQSAEEVAGSTAPAKVASAKVGTGTDRPVLPPGIEQRFVPSRLSSATSVPLHYSPVLLGRAKVHFVQAATGIDEWRIVTLLTPIEESLPSDLWSEAERVTDDELELEHEAQSPATFGQLPAELARPKQYTELAGDLKDYLYRQEKLTLWKSMTLKQVSKPDESESDFRIRLGQTAREQRDALVEKLRQKYSPKSAALEERLRKAEQRVDKEKSQANQQTMSAALSIGASIMGALFGRKMLSAANVNRAAGSMRAASRISKERQDISQANESVEAVKQKLEELEGEFKTECEQAQANLQPSTLPLELVEIQPRKADISVEPVLLVWQPAE
jgi:DNA helicase HerA-like ATPase